MNDVFDIIAFVVFDLLLVIPTPWALHEVLWLQP
jgi:hypothetical protein